MLSIQEVGTEILTNNPKNFYIFIGSEYGIKDRYLDILKSHYGEFIESETVSNVLNLMRTKRIIPLKPTLYIVRYDESFISSLSESTSKEISNTNIVGTIVCIYESSKHASKLSKYLPNYSVSLDSISPTFIQKYLQSEFSGLPDRFINIAVSSSANYGQAKLMCRCMKLVDVNKLYRLTDEEIASLFGRSSTSSDDNIRAGVAARNFNYLIDALKNYEGESDAILYCILSTMLELDKLLDNNRTQSDLRKYINLWTREDIYHMFMNTFKELENMRSLSIADTDNCVIYLFALLLFPQIPAPEDMS